MKCYIAGPLYTDGDRWYLERIDSECKEANIETYLPHRDAGLCSATEKNTKYYFEIDYKNILSCDFMIAVLHGTDVDSGTAWEIGCAYSLNKYIVGIADDIRIDRNELNINLMISNSIDITYSFSELVNKLKLFIQEK